MATKKRKVLGQDGDLPVEAFDSRSEPFSGDGDTDDDLAAAAAEEDAGEDVDALIESLTRDQLVSLLRFACSSDPSTVAEIRRLADLAPSHRKLFVHGLGWDTSSDGLRDAFAPYGEIEDCRVVFDKSTGRSKGYGFILFHHRISARAALRRSQKLIDGRMTACQLASSGPPNPTTNPNLNLSSERHASHDNLPRKIYVGNVHEDIDGGRLRSFFSGFGEIEEGPIGFDRWTGKPKGFALFVYKTVEGACRALEEPNKNFEGHLLYCQKATDSGKLWPGGCYGVNSFNTTNNPNANAGSGAYNGSGYRAGSGGDMGLAAHQAALFGQGLLGMTAGQAFGQGMQPSAATLALLAAAGQNPAAFGLNPVLSSLNPAAIAAALGAGGQPGVNPASVSALAAPGYGMGSSSYQSTSFQGPPGFQGQLPAAQQGPGGGVGVYQSGSIGGQGSRSGIGQIGGYAQH